MIQPYKIFWWRKKDYQTKFTWMNILFVSLSIAENTLTQAYSWKEGWTYNWAVMLKSIHCFFLIQSKTSKCILPRLQSMWPQCNSIIWLSEKAIVSNHWNLFKPVSSNQFRCLLYCDELVKTFFASAILVECFNDLFKEIKRLLTFSLTGKFTYHKYLLL